MQDAESNARTETGASEGDPSVSTARVAARMCRHAAFSILQFGLLAACSRSTAPVQISHSDKGAFESALVNDRSGFALAWYDSRDGNAEIYLRSVDETGQPSGPERRLTETPDSSYEASLERIGDMYVVAWYEQSMRGEQTAMVGAWNRDGSRQWMHAIAPASRNPVIRTDGHSIVAAWIQSTASGSESVFMGRWGADGEEQGARTLVAPASPTTWNLNLDLDGTGAWLVFDTAISTRASEIYLARVDASGAHVERLTRDDGIDSKYPDLRLGGDGRAALAWYDMRDGNDEVYLFVGPRSQLRREIDGSARRVTDNEGESIGAYLAWNKGRLGLAWSDKTPGVHEIYFQSFDGDGMPLRSAARVTRSDRWSLVPAIQPWRDGFALAWTEYQPTSNPTHDGTGEIFFALLE